MQPSLQQTIDSRSALLAAIQHGFQPAYLFFWQLQTPRPRTIGSDCLSQWYPAPFTVDGVLYHTAENFMMAEKARLFGDTATLQKILDEVDPQQVKNLGKLVRGFDANVWKHRAVDVVVRGNLAKFAQHAALQAFLRQTGSAILAEASPYDKIWGIGLAESDPRARKPDQWQGLNQLGFALMVVRSRLAG